MVSPGPPSLTPKKLEDETDGFEKRATNSKHYDVFSYRYPGNCKIYIYVKSYILPKGAEDGENKKRNCRFGQPS